MTRRAYPRSRGATVMGALCYSGRGGLSPLARGNRFLLVGVAGDQGPIPARAGQPGIGFAHLSLSRAYPRSRGATRRPAAPLQRREGLSPLARGNRSRRPPTARRTGPIPARAGQPSISPSCPASNRAYPRSRGATGERAAQIAAFVGLSPLARGNPAGLMYTLTTLGPIPARAGQPTMRCSVLLTKRAYPRSRGATFSPAFMGRSPWGLSPLARGNPALDPRWWVLAGPIPARAGQPHHHHRRRWPTRAYPRSRGATGCATVLPPLV